MTSCYHLETRNHQATFTVVEQSIGLIKGGPAINVARILPGDKEALQVLRIVGGPSVCFRAHVDAPELVSRKLSSRIET